LNNIFIGCTSKIAGAAAEHAAARKSLKYSSHPTSLIFQLLALENLGPINSTGITFHAELGRKQGRGDGPKAGTS